MVLLIAVVLLAAGCAKVPPEQVQRDALIGDMARECESRVPGTRFERVDHYGRPWFSYRHPNEHAAFQACLSEQFGRLASRLISPGTVRNPREVTESTIGVTTRDNYVFVQVAINDRHPATLLLGTGAFLIVVSPVVARRSGLHVDWKSPHVIASVFGGRIVSMPFVRAASLRLGGFAVENIDVAVYEAFPDTTAVDGILGNNFLRHFAFTVDRARNELALTLEPSRGTPADREPPVTAGRSPSADQDAAGVLAPVWKPGYEWQYRWESSRGSGTFVWRVDRIDSADGVDYYVVKSGTRREIFFRRSDLAYLWTEILSSSRIRA